MGRNSPYCVNDFMRVLLDAVEHIDFTNNTCVRVGGPTGETVFSRLENASFDKINKAFIEILEEICPSIKKLLRGRKVTLAFDTTDEPFYGKVEGFYIHSYRPVRGSTGCFKYITVSVINRDKQFILGSLPVRIGADIVASVIALIHQAKRFFAIEMTLFDRGFVDYRLVKALQNAEVRYKIFWRKDKRTSKILKKMKRGELKENTYVGKYSRDKSSFKVKTRFVYLKKYKRHKKSKAYNWVFATNTRQKNQHYYVDKYRKRWSIETTFRVLDNIQIKTTTKNEVIRHFINIFCCLVYNLWKLENILEIKTTLKNFAITINKELKTLIQEKTAPNG